jgi:glycosyltransferase involved in cell wall biosynthesis
MTLLFVDTERVWRGGQDQLLSLLRGLAERGHRVHLVCYPGTLVEERARQAGVAVHPARIRSEWDPRAFWRILGLLRRLRPEILAFNTPRPILLGSLASRFAPARARIIFRRVNFPLRRGPLTRVKYSWGIDCIIAISESIRQQLESAGIPGPRIRVVYEGLDLGPPPSRSPRAAGAARPMVVGTVAHMSAEKGHRYLVEAAALIPRVHSRVRFVIVGDGACRQAVERQVDSLGLGPCFEFAGFRTDTARWLESFDLFVLPSLSEGLSSAILSAMAAALPVVATEVGGIPELVEAGNNGLLVAPGDARALADAITFMADHPEEAERMGARGRRRMEERFTLERKIAETEQICERLIAPRPEISHHVHA